MQFSLKCSNAAVSVLVRSGFTAKLPGDVAQDSADVLPERDEGGYGRLLFRVVPVDAGQCDVAVLRCQFLKREAGNKRGGEAAAHGVPGHFLYQFLVVIQAVVTCSGALQVSIVALRKED